ncbi:hypothetical protein [Fusibacter ferrireducens]|uniref:Dynamin family protein n=1 Tax=Fusibacter ferrireducens TaxID=2785058 RepID=A0ABR9ZX81_9FIRM|nr:hypothetical protein [Fusibacter ferrireducens]MBF4694758.1 hypothetical protein [Fusibacter ferrireducens]
MKIGTPSEIYKKVTHEIESIIDAFKSKKYADVDHNALEQAITRLEEMKSKLSLELESLNENAEWDVFNIAFYGETNAGKSTLIETLRILLDEPTKVSEREAFDLKKHEIIDIEENFATHCKLMEGINEGYSLEVKNLNEKVDLLKIDICEIEKNIQCFEEEMTEVENLINEKKKSSVLNFFRYIIGILKEQQMLWDLKNSIQNSSFTLNNLISQCDELEIEIDLRSKEMNLELEKMEKISLKFKETLDQLNEEILLLSDGAIIGDGQSDYTRDVISYNFSRKNQSFALLDLPGIEGKEDLVMHEINSAVQKAHIVFYITNKAAPPQNGNDNNGTLQKIKKHLGQHTEVYSIYNKRVKNHQQLRPRLINEDEENSLVELETIMKENLGNHYSKNKVLTAYPAFLSVGKNTQEAFLKAQEKFLEKYHRHDELLSVTQVEQFANWLVDDIISECKSKIIKSNYNKVSVRLSDTITSITAVYGELRDLKKLLDKTRRGTVNQLDEAIIGLKTNLQNAINKEIDNFKRQLREKIYLEIEKEISGKVFKEIYEEILEHSLVELDGKMNKSIDNVLNDYKENIKSVIEKHNRYENELLDVYSKRTSLNRESFADLKLKGVDNWQGVIEVVVAIGGVIAAILAGGPLVIGLAVLAAFINVSKNLINLFDKKKRIAHQKSVANKSIDKTSSDILKSKLKSVENSIDELSKSMEKFKHDIRKPTKNLDSMIYILKEAEDKMAIIQSTIIREGVR